MQAPENNLTQNSTPPAKRYGRAWYTWSVLGILATTALYTWPNKLAATGGTLTNPAPFSREDDRLADCQLLIRARQALQQDGELGALNLGVTVRGRVVTLWGGIPSQALARRAEERLRQVAGIAQVRNEFRLETAGESKKNLFAQPSVQPSLGGPLAPGSLTSHAPLRPQELRSGAAFEPNETTAREAVPVMPPLVITFRPPPMPEAPPPERKGPLVQTLDSLRLSESRFHPIRVEVRAGVVYLSGVGAGAEDVMDFARLAARVPGVERVRLGDAPKSGLGPLQLP